MIPVTYPSSVSTSKESQMVVYALPSVTGLRRWTDYIPVKLQATGADIANSFNTNGYLACDFLQTTTGRQAWIDYIPVFVDNAATVPWQVSDTGFIPFNTLPGGGLYYLGPTLDLNFVSSLSNPLFSATAEDYTLNTNFLSLFYQVEAQYSVLGTNGVEQKNFADIVTFTRASTATYFNSAGTLTTATTNEARFDHNPSTLAPLGFLIEEQRTNSIRNNTMVGAVAGTPGTLPTNWQKAEAASLVFNVVSTGTENGIAYVDIRLSGTASSTSTSAIQFEQNSQISASQGQTWSVSSYVKIVAGSTSGLNTVNVGWEERAATFLAVNQSVIAPQNGGDLSTGRVRHTGTNANASTTFVKPYINFTPLNGAAINITLRIGLPQLEQGAFATSVIPTTTTALTRSADVASVNTLSPWFNVVEGSFVTEWVVSALGVDNNIASLSDGTTNNRHQNYVANTNAVLVRTAASGVASNNPNGTAVANAIGKFAFGYGSGTTAASFNGSAVTTTTQALPSSISTLYLGQSPAGGGQKQIWLRRYTFYPRKLSNAELQAITA